MTNQGRISDPVKLPCGLVLKNRLMKAAMAENMSKDHTPSKSFSTAYKAWGNGGWGGIMTGNVQIDDRWLGNNFDLTFTNTSVPGVKARWREYADACRIGGSAAIVQVNHPGRQSPITAGSRGIFEKNLAPSPIPLSLGDNIVARAAQKLMFGKPREMSVAEIEDLVIRFADAAKFLSEVGFDGIEIHAAHGYLLSLFMSTRLNHRTDAYGDSSANRVRIVTSIIGAIRAVVPASFAVGIKLNSVDLQRSGDMDDAMQQIQHIIAAGIDFLEISGGSYEDPKMTGRSQEQEEEKKTAVSQRTAQREAYFLDFAKAIRSRFPNVVLMVTGGFRSLAGMQSALEENACDIIGVARPAAIDPAWATKLLEAEKSGTDIAMHLRNVELGWFMKKVPVRAIGAGAESKYYSGEITQLGKGLQTKAPI